MQANLQLALDWTRSNEGGFAIREDEPGGSVNRGVSMLVFREYRGKHGLPEPTLDDLRALTDDTASVIYEEKYAKPIHFDELPSGLDFALLDVAVMEGVRGSLLLLQQALDLRTVSGMWDVQTWGAVTTCDVPATIAKLTVLQMNKKMHSISVDKFGKGWGDRIVRRYNRARELL